jgi:hypothetical protein
MNHSFLDKVKIALLNLLVIFVMSAIFVLGVFLYGMLLKSLA